MAIDNNLLMQNESNLEDNIEEQNEMVEVKENQKDNNNETEKKLDLINSKYDIGSKEGNELAFNTFEKRIYEICDDQDLAISEDFYFVPTSNKYYTIYELFTDEAESKTLVEKIQYYANLIDDLITLQKNRVTFPSVNSHFSKYYLDTLFFLKDGRYPLYKENSFNDVIKSGYSNHFFVKGQKVINDVLEIEKKINSEYNTILSCVEEINNNTDESINIEVPTDVFNYKDNVSNEIEKCKKILKSFLSTLETNIETLCNKLSEPVEQEQGKDIGVNQLSELIFKFFHIAFVSSGDDIGINEKMKFCEFPEHSQETLAPIISLLDLKTKTWTPLTRCAESIISVIGNGSFMVKDSIKVVNNIYTILVNDPKNTDVLVYNPFIIPFNNGNYNVLTKEFENDPDDFKEPIPARLKVKYNEKANYHDFDKYGITPFEFVTFPFVNGDYSEEEAKEREIYAGNVIADILTPFNRAIGGDSIYWFAGDGGSGKTTYVEMIQMLVGNAQSRNVEIAFLDNNQFALGDIFGKYALIGNEATDSGSIGVTKLKQIASGDRVPFEEKFKQSRSSIPTLTPIITSNGAPNLKQDGGASERRFKVIKFNVVFEKQATSDKYRSANPTKVNPAIKTHALKDNYFLECIAKYAIDMLSEHAIRNKYSLEIPIPKSVKDDTSDAVKQNDIVSAFADFLGNTVDKPIPMAAEHLYTVYEVFAEVIGKEKFKGGLQKFKNEIITHEAIIKLKRDEEYTYKEGQKEEKVLKPTKKQSKSSIMNTQTDLVNSINGGQDVNGFAHIENNSNNIKKVSTSYEVLWIIPFESQEPVTTEDIFTESRETGKPVSDSDLPF